jgi:carnosine N-methyltransferase
METREPPSDDFDMSLDRACFLRTVQAFRQYAADASRIAEVRRGHFAALSPAHKALLGIDLDGLFHVYHSCIRANDALLQTICTTSSDLFASYWPHVDVAAVAVEAPTVLDMDKAFSTLRQIARDWSAEGQAERDAVYKPIVEYLCSQFPDRAARVNVRVLNPGAGLCRLSVDLALAGFACQSNEFSYHMLIAGHFLQNHTVAAAEFQIHPHCNTTCNLINREDQFAAVLVPDLCPAEALQRLEDECLEFGQLSMVAGDFLEVYAKPENRGAWHALATCFFIDTAHNVIRYLEVMHGALTPGGLWVNIGPLLYHFADEAGEAPGKGELCVELSLGELLNVASRLGFDMVVPPRFIDTTYASGNRSMKQLVYRCAFFVMKKR